LTGGRLALLMPDGGFLALDGGRDEMRRWLRLAVACLDAAESAAPSPTGGSEDWRWHVTVPALSVLLQATMDAYGSDDLACFAPLLALLGITLSQGLHGSTD